MAEVPSLLAEQIDRLFDELVRRRWGTQAKLAPARVREVEDGWEIELAVPEMAPENLEVELRGRELTVRGTKRTARTGRVGLFGYTRSTSGLTFMRQFLLPEVVPAEAVEARWEDGVLRIRIRRS
jgi:HSP20 family protein